jgi:hypothetical protein
MRSLKCSREFMGIATFPQDIQRIGDLGYGEEIYDAVFV